MVLCYASFIVRVEVLGKSRNGRGRENCTSNDFNELDVLEHKDRQNIDIYCIGIHLIVHSTYPERLAFGVHSIRVSTVECTVSE